MSVKFWIIGILAMCGLAMALPACKSTPTVDPDNGVSTASYRQCIAKGESNLASISSRLQVAREQDQEKPIPAHSVAWWDAQIDEVKETGNLFHSTLQGSTK